MVISYLITMHFFNHQQTVVAQINHAIGAAGVVSVECKAVVAQYGKQILEVLLSEVCWGTASYYPLIFEHSSIMFFWKNYPE